MSAQLLWEHRPCNVIRHQLATADIGYWAQSSAFLWRYEPVRCTGKSYDWLTIFRSHNKVDCSEIPTVLSNLLYHYFFIELWHILILWLAKMPNGGMPDFTLACWLLSRPNWRIVSKLTTDVMAYCTEASNQKSKYAYRKIFFYKKSTGSHWGINTVIKIKRYTSVTLCL